jgi:hypothetical protein
MVDGVELYKFDVIGYKLVRLSNYKIGELDDNRTNGT